MWFLFWPVVYLELCLKLTCSRISKIFCGHRFLFLLCWSEDITSYDFNSLEDIEACLWLIICFIMENVPCELENNIFFSLVGEIFYICFLDSVGLWCFQVYYLLSYCHVHYLTWALCQLLLYVFWGSKFVYVQNGYSFLMDWPFYYYKITLLSL